MWRPRFQSVCGVAAAISLMSAVAVLGWLVDSPLLRSLVPGRVPMSPIMALGALLGASALCLAARSRHKALARGLAKGVCGVALAGALLQWTLPDPPAVAQGWLWRAGESWPAFQISLQAVAGLLMFGISILALDSPRAGTRRAARASAALVVVLGVTGVAAHMAGAPSYITTPTTAVYRGLSLNSGLIILALGCGVFALPPREGLSALLGGEHGKTLRRLLATVALLPLLLAALATALRDKGLVTARGGLAVVTTFTVVAVASAVLVAAHHLLRTRAAEQRSRRAALAATEHAEAMELERAQLATVLDQIPDPVLIIDVWGRHAQMNRAARRLSRPDGTVRDRFGNLIPFDFRAPDGRPLTLAELPMTPTFERSEPVHAREVLVRDAHGELRPISVSSSAVRDAQGRVTHVAAVMHDIGEFKRLQRLREEWSSVVAHDLRQPIQVVGLASEMLTRKCRESAASPEIDKQLARILGATRTLERMIQDLQDASAVDAHRLKVAPRPLPLEPFVYELIERLPEQRTIDVRCDCEPDLTVRADPGRLEQILMNLLSNADKYRAPGTPIDLNACRRGDEAHISVSNEGPGIDPDELPRVFDRFMRARGQQTRSRPGLGLGLYITRGLVEAHGGRIWATSDPGRRTTFTVALPLARGDERAEAPSPPA